MSKRYIIENIMKCLNCKNNIEIKEIKKHMSITCDECGCIMTCLGVDDCISRWRVVNPFNIEDRRNSN